MNISDYLFKNVKVISTDKQEYVGFVDMYNSASDNDEGVDSIGIIPNRNAKTGVELFATDIASIEIIKP